MTYHRSDFAPHQPIKGSGILNKCQSCLHRFRSCLSRDNIGYLKEQHKVVQFHQLSIVATFRWHKIHHVDWLHCFTQANHLQLTRAQQLPRWHFNRQDSERCSKWIISNPLQHIVSKTYADELQWYDIWANSTRNCTAPSSGDPALSTQAAWVVYRLTGW